jgi:ribose transport system substrate-binding protein
MKLASRTALSPAGNEIAKQPYLVGPILRACELLKAFRSPGEPLALCDLVGRTRLNKTTVFRAAQSLVAGGLLERVGRDQYRCLLVPCRTREFRIGYAAMTGNSLFSREISDSLRLAAAAKGIELIELDNQLNARVAVHNSERLVRERVDLAIEFQVHQKAAPAIALNFSRAKIPVIAIHTPHPGAVFFGGNNYVAGRIGGRALARWAGSNWKGQVDSILMLGHSAAGPLTNSRLTGTAVGISEILKDMNPSEVISVDVKGGYAETMDAVIKHLSRSKASHILVGCINDSVALGAVRAFAEVGRSEHCAVVGQNGTIAARAELREPNSRLIGSVGFFPEKYGEHIVALALDMLHGESAPPAVFIKHTLITKQNVNTYYPNDALAIPPDMNSLLFNRYH